MGGENCLMRGGLIHVSRYPGIPVFQYKDFIWNSMEKSGIVGRETNQQFRTVLTTWSDQNFLNEHEVNLLKLFFA